MKHIKILSLVLAIAFVTASAFTRAHSSLDTWRLKSTAVSATDPTNYELGSGSSCTGADFICDIQAPEDGSSGFPDLQYEVTTGVTVQDKIEQALSTDQPNDIATLRD